MAVVVDPFTEIREQIEAAAQRSDIDEVERTALLRSFRDRLVELQGAVARYAADGRALAEAKQVIGYEADEKLRANATIRDQLIERNMATPEELDEMGFFSHADLDKLTEEGLLEEAINFLERLHPRDRSGKWTDKFGGLLRANLSSPKPPAEPLVPAPRRPSVPRPRAVSKPVPSKPDPTARREYLEQRVKKQVASANFTEAEAHFNDAGKVSQRSLAEYVDRAATAPKTVDLHSSMDENGRRIYDESRRPLHEKLTDMWFRQRVFDPSAKEGKGDWVFSETAPHIQPQENPEVMFSGGGYAAGKGGVVKLKRAKGEEPASGYDGPTPVLDPDLFKPYLMEADGIDPEDPESNMRVYQEAWDLAQEIQARAQEQKLNIVVDGISDTSPEEMIARVQSFTDKGYKARASYVDIPTEEALKRAADRAKNATSASDRRHIPEVIMRSVHRDVAATVPNMVRRLREENIDMEIEVWDNDQGKDEQGNFRPPLRFFHYANGVETVEDAALWDRFQRKASERILGVD